MWPGRLRAITDRYKSLLTLSAIADAASHDWPLQTITDHCEPLLMLHWPVWAVTDCYKLLLTATSHYWLLQAITDCYKLLLTATSHYWLLQAITDCYKPLLTATSHYWLLQAITDCYKPLLTATSHYWLLQAISDITSHYWLLQAITDTTSHYWPTWLPGNSRWPWNRSGMTLLDLIVFFLLSSSCVLCVCVVYVCVLCVCGVCMCVCVCSDSSKSGFCSVHVELDTCQIRKVLYLCQSLCFYVCFLFLFFMCACFNYNSTTH